MGNDYLEEKRRRLQDMVFSDRRAAIADPAYPGYHLASPAHGILDYWGNTYKDGWYHILYHAVPNDSDPWSTVFGHTRSRDMLHWEEMPFPIVPKDNEMRLNDGCIVENGKGDTLMLYTCCYQNTSAPRTHAAALASDDLSRFERIPEADPFMTLDSHGGPAFQNGWSDPWVFRAGGRNFMLMSKCVLTDGSGDPMPIYEATDDTLLRWEYKGIFFDHNGEVINFFPMGDKWVLIYSPYHAPRYFVGDMDMDSLRFIPRQEGILSYGYQNGKERGFYATCLYQKGGWQGERRVMTGWLSGTKGTVGWRDCMSVPRELGLNSRLQVTQLPIPELDTLHGDKVLEVADITADSHQFDLTSSLLDIRLTYTADTPVTLTLAGADTLLTLALEKERFAVNGNVYEAAPFAPGEDKTVRILVDKCVAEIFLGDGAVSTVGFFPYGGEALSLGLTAATVTALEVWAMNEAKTTLCEELKEYE